MKNISGKSVLITGASSGIGLATARYMAELGARVFLVSNVLAELEAAVAEIGLGRGCEGGAAPLSFGRGCEGGAAPLSFGRGCEGGAAPLSFGRGCEGGAAPLSLGAAFREVDLTIPEQLHGLWESVEREWGPLDILVNCAGIGYQADVRDFELEVVRRTFEVNFFALVELSRQALIAMGARGHGHIVNVTSASARRGLAHVGAYAASKAAAHSFSQSLRVEAARVGVGVSEVLPISVCTNFFRDSPTATGRGYQPKGLVQTPDLIARLIVRAIRENRAELCSHALTSWGLALDGLAPNWVAWLFNWLDRRRRD